jgi:hypothetical protein
MGVSIPAVPEAREIVTAREEDLPAGLDVASLGMMDGNGGGPTAQSSDGSFKGSCGRAPLLPGPWAEAKGARIPRLV